MYIVLLYIIYFFFLFFFFFQAEDGIRDADVTGVQTCALPISPSAKFCHDQPVPTGTPHAQRRLPLAAPENIPLRLSLLVAEPDQRQNLPLKLCCRPARAII